MITAIWTFASRILDMPYCAIPPTKSQAIRLNRYTLISIVLALSHNSTSYHHLPFQPSADSLDEEARDEGVESYSRQGVEHGVGGKLAVVDLAVFPEEGEDVDGGGEEILALQY